MNSRNTWLWLLLAGSIFAFIFFFERHLSNEPAGPPLVLPSLKPAEIQTIHVQPKNHRGIRVFRTNDVWHMTDPVAYPANSAQIEAFLSALQKLTASPYLSAAELKEIPDADQRFGFDAPFCTLLLNQKRHLILIGNKTPPGDRVYLQVVGVEGVFIVDADLLRLIPQTAGLWRETALADWSSLNFDRLVVTNAGKLLELQLNPSNQLWRMLSPNNVRANSTKVSETLTLLQGARVEQFVTDNAGMDLDAFGLQNPELSLALLRGTNSVLRLDFGKSPTNNAALIFARRADQDTVVAVPRTFIEPWTSAHSHAFRDFFDPHLVALSEIPDAVEIQAEDQFTLQRRTNVWNVVPPGWLADSNLVVQLFANLTNLQVTAAQIEKDIVPTADLPKYGLAQPFRQYTLRKTSVVEGIQTNIVLAQLEFGTNQDKVFARVSGESFVYSVDPGMLRLLPQASWQMRDRHIWDFAMSNVLRITIQQGARQRELVRTNSGKWLHGKGSQGILDDLVSAQIEETVFRLSDLSAAYWAGRGTEHLESFGITADAHKVSIELNSGGTHSVTFGGTAPSQFPYAMTALDGQPWIFEFPWTTYQFVQLYLTIPDVP
ncbi:MAG TPA: DUF4340 domain-containing protein [Verrucomicrobiae bacterium]|nr:DUF4340 domain-containing protein [Verrucomicrobiae bacterium]